MSIARRRAKCSSACLRCAGQKSPPVQRATASSGSRTIAEPHSGHVVGITNALAPRGRLSSEDADDLGDHVARAAHDHGVADVHVLAPHLVLVVQRRVGDGDAADEHRRESRDRRDRAGAPDLDVDAEHFGRHLLGGKLVRDRPARLARDEAELALQVEAIDLVDDAVDLERQLRRAARPRPRRTRASASATARDAAVAIHRKAERLEGVEERRRACPGSRTLCVSPMPYAKNCSGRCAVIAGSSWRTAPAAVLRGLMNVF